MMKRHILMTCLVLTAAFIVSGCRAYNSGYSSKEADLALTPIVKKPPAAPSVSGSTTGGASPSTSAPAPTVDYSKDTTDCKTPDGIKVGKNPSKILGNAGWVMPVDGEQVVVTAAKKGLYSAAITIQKTTSDKVTATLSFTVKQTDADKFSACDFKYSEGKDRIYQGISGAIEIDQVNNADSKTSTITNTGSFDFMVTRAATATKVQSVNMGATAPNTLTSSGVPLMGSYFIDSLTESAAH